MSPYPTLSQSVTTGETVIPDLPRPQSSAKIPISETLDLKTPSMPPVIELPNVNPENDLYRTGASCDQTCPCRQERPKYELSDIFMLYGEAYRKKIRAKYGKK